MRLKTLFNGKNLFLLLVYFYLSGEHGLVVI